MSAVRQVTVCECWSRDGIQSWPKVVDTKDKLSIIDAVLATGVRELDLTSFVPSRVVPQFYDSRAVLDHVAGRADVYVRVLAPNLRGTQTALAVHAETGAIDAIGFPISASEAHNLANVRRTHEEHFEQIAPMVSAILADGVTAMAAVATSFGCPIVGRVDPSTVFGIAGRLADLGVTRIMLSDTTGLADPRRVREFVDRAHTEMPGVDLIAHFHDSRGTGLLNTWAAVEAGVKTVDASLGGLGGEPASVEQNHSGETGNIVTEDLVVALERAGFETGIDVEALLAAGRRQKVLTGHSRAQTIYTGAGLVANR